jgi:lipoprotein-anchoring transpeptidase ErfK/SrfK
VPGREARTRHAPLASPPVFRLGRQHLVPSLPNATAGLLLLVLAVGACGDGSGSDAVQGEAASSTTTTTAVEATEGAEGPTLPTGNTWIAQARRPRVFVYAEPDAEAQPMEVLANPNENGAPLVFLVDGTDVSGDLVPVFLPVPPNGSTGWVRARDVSLVANPYHIRVELTAHKLTVTKASEVVLDTVVGVGTADAPTPGGTYYIKELLEPPDPNGVYGVYAYGLSGFTNNPEVAEQFGDGGVIGLHGTNQPELLGQDVSHGCIRVTNEVITEMAGYLPLGTPVEIIA